MELYTLTSAFLPKESVTDMVSVIWTERYSSAGDVEIVVPPVPSQIQRLRPGTLLGLRGTSEIMMVDTLSIENGLLTVKGYSLLTFLNHRWGWFRDPDYDVDQPNNPRVREYTAITTAGNMISSAVYGMAINPTVFASSWAAANLDWARDTIPGLTLGQVDNVGAVQTYSIPLGPLYDGIQKLASDEGVGMKLYLQSASYSDGYSLKFATYRGRNRTSEQTDRLMVRLTPKMDSLSDVKEINSISQYKNVIYVAYQGKVTIHYLDLPPAIPTGFDRRAILVDAPDLYFSTSAKITAFRAQVARNTIAEHTYIQAIDGRVSSKIPYIFGQDYGLGDVVELEGFTGTFVKARVVEYIRSQNEYGEQEYPTLAMIDPLQTGYMPDLEPSDGDRDWDDDPDYDKTGPGEPKAPATTDPVNPNPDPTPDFTPPSPSTEPAGFIALGAYPDQDNGETLAYVYLADVDEPDNIDKRLRPDVWVYPGDGGGESSTYWTDLIPQYWTRDRKWIVLQSRESKESSEDRPWSQGKAWWKTDGIDHVRLTDTVGNDTFKIPPEDGPLGPIYQWQDRESAFWFAGKAIGGHSADDRHLYLPRKRYAPYEYLYTNGVFSTNSAEEPAVIFGPIQAQEGGPYELHFSSSGKITPGEDTRAILGPDDFPNNMRWSEFQGIKPSPDGDHIVFYRTTRRLSNVYSISGMMSPSSGTFVLNSGRLGVATFGYQTTAPIPYNATAKQVFDALAATAFLEDPRISGYPYIPYTGGPLPNQVVVRFNSVDPDEDLWLGIDGSNLSWPFGGDYEVSYSYGYGRRRWFICSHTGEDLEELELEDTNAFPEWSPDSSKLHWIARSTDGKYSFRWANYDIASKEISYPLDYRGAIAPDSSGNGPLSMLPLYSPDGDKIIYVLREEDGTQSLILASSDGTDGEVIYHQTAPYNSTDHGVLLLSNRVAWNTRGTKVMVIDSRDPSPVWVIDLSDKSLEKIYSGRGWSDSSQQIWLYDPLTFDFDL